MPFIPHNKTDIKEMLGAIEAGSIDDLFDEIPKNLLRSYYFLKKILSLILK